MDQVDPSAIPSTHPGHTKTAAEPMSIATVGMQTTTPT